MRTREEIESDAYTEEYNGARDVSEEEMRVLMLEVLLDIKELLGV